MPFGESISFHLKLPTKDLTSFLAFLERHQSGKSLLKSVESSSRETGEKIFSRLLTGQSPGDGGEDGILARLGVCWDKNGLRCLPQCEPHTGVNHLHIHNTRKPVSIQEREREDGDGQSGCVAVDGPRGCPIWGKPVDGNIQDTDLGR